MTNGTAQLHIGADCIDSLLLADDASKQRAFIWTLAHEIGHLTDPLFKAYGKSFVARKMYALALELVIIWACMQAVFVGTGIMHTAMVPTISLLTPYLSLLILSKIINVQLHRQFEYNADATALHLLPDFKIEDQEIAVRSITQATVTFINETNAVAANASWFTKMRAALRKRFTRWYYFHKHPSLQARVLRVKELLAAQKS
jgi:Zn-dependent protease with chaperone function